jgi:hypothetical protein
VILGEMQAGWSALRGQIMGEITSITVDALPFLQEILASSHPQRIV